MRVLLSVFVVLVSAMAASGPTGEFPVWAPNANQIALVVPSRFGFAVDVMAPSGDDRRTVAVSERSGIAAQLAWAGSRRLIVSVSPNGVLRSIDIATGRAVDLGGSPGGTGSGAGPLSLGADDAFSVSRDGARVAYVSDSPYQITNNAFAIGIVRSSGGSGHLLPQPINASDADPSFSPDGSKVVLTRVFLFNGRASAPSLVVQSVSRGQAQSLKHIEGDRPVWSPNGSWIAYQQATYTAEGLVHSELRIVRPSGDDSRTVWNPTGHEGLAFSWSPDSARIAFLTESGEIGVATLAGKVTIFKLPTNIVATSDSINGAPNTPPQWSANGRTLVFTAAPRSDRKDLHVYAIEADGLGFRRIR